MFIDTHAHLNFKSFASDYKEAIKRAFDADVRSIINVGSNLETSEKAIEIAREFDSANSQSPITNGNIYAAVGLHPIHVKDEEFNFNKYLDLAKDPKVVAIGETGIDLYHDKSTVDIQRDVFEKSLRIAAQVKKPVILHSRNGEEDLRAWLMGQKNLPKGVLHCFSGSQEFAEFMLESGFLISFTGIITFSKNPNIEKLIKNIPLEKMMIETDSPYLSPEPYRGKRNEPAYVVEVAKKIAKIKNISLEEVEKTTTLTAKKLFDII